MRDFLMTTPKSPILLIEFCQYQEFDFKNRPQYKNTDEYI